MNGWRALRKTRPMRLMFSYPKGRTIPERLMVHEPCGKTAWATEKHEHQCQPSPQ